MVGYLVYDDLCPFCTQVYGVISMYNSEVSERWKIHKINKNETWNPVLSMIARTLNFSSPLDIPTPTLFFRIPNTRQAIVVIGVTVEDFYIGLLERLIKESKRCEM